MLTSWDWFRQQVDDARGGNYQTLINKALRSFHPPAAGIPGDSFAWFLVWAINTTV